MVSFTFPCGSLRHSQKNDFHNSNSYHFLEITTGIQKHLMLNVASYFKSHNFTYLFIIVTNRQYMWLNARCFVAGSSWAIGHCLRFWCMLIWTRKSWTSRQIPASNSISTLVPRQGIIPLGLPAVVLKDLVIDTVPGWTWHRICQTIHFNLFFNRFADLLLILSDF